VEALGRVDAATFDKTGTLTYGRPAVRRVVPLAKDLETAELLALDGSGPAEAALPHAAALAAHVGARLPEPAERRRASRLGKQHAPIDDDQRAGHVRRRV
jgi:cation transport ATPase